MRRVFLALLLVSACKADSSPGRSAEPARHDTAPKDDGMIHIENLDDEALYKRAMLSGECSNLEGSPCTDVYAPNVRCALATRAIDAPALHRRLLEAMKSSDRATRAAALRVLADFSDEPSVRAVHDALMDADATIACPAARYGIWFAASDAKRLSELEQRCDGKPIIAMTRELVEKGAAGKPVKAGATCAEIRAAGP